MKHIRIIFTLTFTVLLTMVAVFQINEMTAGTIYGNNLKKLQEGLLKVAPSSYDGVLEELTGDYDLSTIDLERVYADQDKDTVIVYQAYAYGFNSAQPISYLIGIDLETNKVSGFLILENYDSDGYGQNASTPLFMNQFIGMELEPVLNGEIDGVAGATGTTGGIKASLNEVISFHNTNFGGGPVGPTDEEIRATMMEDIFPSATDFVKVTTNPANDAIINMYNVMNGTTQIGYLYEATGSGASVAGGLAMIYYIGINMDKEYAGFRMYDSQDTPGYKDFYLEDSYGDSYNGVALGEEDSITGATAGSATGMAILTSVNEVMEYHVVEILGEMLDRPEPVENLNVINAFNQIAASYTSIYASQAYDASILNVYELKDETDTVIGYIYYGMSAGYGGTIEFAIGIDITDNTHKLIILKENESWEDAKEYASYTGDEVFPDTTWLLNWQEDTVQNILDAEIDGVTGASTTTGNRDRNDGLIFAIESVLKYHQNNTGGGE